MARSRFICRITAVCVLAFAAAAVHAQKDYPSRPIRVMTPFAPGGGSDTLARLMGPKLHESMGQPIVVDNRPGGGGSMGATMAARSEPDGYTVIIVSASYGANGVLHDMPFDPVKGIQPIILFGETGLVVTIHPSRPIHSMKDLIAYSNANPNKLNFGSAGVGGLAHLAGELFKLQTKVTFTHIPYKGSGPVMTALLGGEIDSSFSSLVPSIPHVKAGRLRALAVTPAKRSRALPDVPTIAETVPGYDVVHWYGMWGPKGIPQPVVRKLNGEIAKILRTDAILKWFENEGMEIAGGPPEQFGDLIRRDVEKWGKLVKAANIVITK